jgi:glycosyltransferase involved in cell wall biosynthesis
VNLVDYLKENNNPVITIGMPVYNGAEFIKPALYSLLNQTFKNFELIISDNASTDETGEICKAHAAKDKRIKYIRQRENIGYLANFQYVLMAARGEYFTWAAHDDIRSLDYLELNYEFLLKNTTYVSSGSPNGFDTWGSEKKLVNFSLGQDEIFKRYQKFFKNCFHSHGLFYCLIRTNVLRDSELLDQIFFGNDWLGVDWAVILYLASKGRMNRTLKGNIILGTHGVSSNMNIFQKYNTSMIEYFIPFYKLSKIVMIFSRELSRWQRFRILSVLVKLNISAKVTPLYQSQKSILYRMYLIFLKPLVKKFLHPGIFQSK